MDRKGANRNDSNRLTEVVEGLLKEVAEEHREEVHKLTSSDPSEYARNLDRFLDKRLKEIAAKKKLPTTKRNHRHT